MFSVSLLLRHNHNLLLRETFYMVHLPAIRLLVSLHDPAYGWNTVTAYLQILAVLAVYWVLLGSLAGLGCRIYLEWRGRSMIGREKL